MYKRQAFEAAGLGEPPFLCEYAGYGVLFTERERRCPPYFNQGMVLAPSPILAGIGSAMYAEMETANRVAETLYRVQVALTYAILRQKLPWRALPVRYNYIPCLLYTSQAGACLDHPARDIRLIPICGDHNQRHARP